MIYKLYEIKKDRKTLVQFKEVKGDHKLEIRCVIRYNIVA